VALAGDRLQGIPPVLVRAAGQISNQPTNTFVLATVANGGPPAWNDIVMAMQGTNDEGHREALVAGATMPTVAKAISLPKELAIILLAQKWTARQLVNYLAPWFASLTPTQSTQMKPFQDWIRCFATDDGGGQHNSLVHMEWTMVNTSADDDLREWYGDHIRERYPPAAAQQTTTGANSNAASMGALAATVAAQTAANIAAQQGATGSSQTGSPGSLLQPQKENLARLLDIPMQQAQLGQNSALNAVWMELLPVRNKKEEARISAEKMLPGHQRRPGDPYYSLTKNTMEALTKLRWNGSNGNMVTWGDRAEGLSMYTLQKSHPNSWVLSKGSTNSSKR
jgi:hypothetical protein